MEQHDLIKFAVDQFESLGLRYMVVGSYASMVLGEPRMTMDIDIVVELGAMQVGDFCSRFPAPEYYVSEPAVRDAIRTGSQFNVIHSHSGHKFDFILPRSDEWGATQLSRRQRVKLLPDREGYTASPEDVILGKIWYYDVGGSEKHLRDIAGILRISGSRVDRKYIDEWATKLGYGEIWKSIQEREVEKGG